MGDVAAVGIGAVAGALCRYQIGNIVSRKISQNPKHFSHLFGWHTAGINICGSFILGNLMGLPVVASETTAVSSRSSKYPCEFNSRSMAKVLAPRIKLMVGVGFCGSFTTFSTFSVDVVTMIGQGQISQALSYVVVNNVGGIFAAFAGFRFAKRIFR